MYFPEKKKNKTSGWFAGLSICNGLSSVIHPQAQVAPNLMIKWQILCQSCVHSSLSTFSELTLLPLKSKGDLLLPSARAGFSDSKLS